MMVFSVFAATYIHIEVHNARCTMHILHMHGRETFFLHWSNMRSIIFSEMCVRCGKCHWNSSCLHQTITFIDCMQFIKFTADFIYNLDFWFLFSFLAFICAAFIWLRYLCKALKLLRWQMMHAAYRCHGSWPIHGSFSMESYSISNWKCLPMFQHFVIYVTTKLILCWKLIVFAKPFWKMSNIICCLRTWVCAIALYLFHLNK